MGERLTIETLATLVGGGVEPHFSPDGTQLLYRNGAENVLLSIPAGEALGKFEGSPGNWAPDTNMIAFEKNGQIFTLSTDDAGAEPRLIAKGTQPTWFPSGDRLLFEDQTPEGAALFRIGLDSQAERERLITTGPAGAMRALCPNGRRLAYVRRTPNPEVLTGLPENAKQLGVFHDLVEVRFLDLAEGLDLGSGAFPAGTEIEALWWSPDGRFLAFLVFNWCSRAFDWRYTKDTRIWDIEANEIFTPELAPGAACRRASWSPDGALLAMVTNPNGYCMFDPAGDVTFFDVSRRRVLSQSSGILATFIPIWRPDGKGVFCRTANHIEQRYVEVSVDGSVVRTLMPERHYCAGVDLSPDSRYLAASLRTFTTLCEIWLCPTDSTPPKRLTNHSTCLDHIAFPETWIHHWRTGDGLEFDGIIIEPPDRTAPDAPLLVWPASERGWNIMDLEYAVGGCLQLVAEQGFRVFIPSHRLTGLSAMGYRFDEFRPAGAGADIAAGIAALLRAVRSSGPVVALGHSYGGDILCEMLVSQADVFTAAVVSGVQPDYALLYNNEMCGNGFLRATLDGPPWKRPLEYLEASPMRGIEAVKASVLIMMGEGDTSTPSAGMFWRALHEAGKDAAFLQFKGQAHAPETPESLMAFLQIGLDWLNRKLGRGR